MLRTAMHDHARRPSLVLGRRAWSSSAQPGVRVPEGTGTALILLAYSVLTNRREGHEGWYVPRNVGVAAALIAGARRRGLSWDDLGLGPAHLARGLEVGLCASGAGAAAVAAAIATASGNAAGRRVLGDRRAALPARVVLRQALVRIPIGTAAFEEIAFRSVLQGLVASRHGSLTGIAVSSAVFGLWHIPPTLAAMRLNDVTAGRVRACIGAVGATAVAGLAFGWLRTAGGHVAAPWLVHWTVSAISLLGASRWQRLGRPATRRA